MWLTLPGLLAGTLGGLAAARRHEASQKHAKSHGEHRGVPERVMVPKSW